MEMLPAAVWKALRDQHFETVDPWIQPRLDRRSRNEKHPVDDFLFDYYPISAKKLRSWNPAFGISLEANESDLEEFNAKNYFFHDGCISLRPDWLDNNKEKINHIYLLLRGTESRPVRNGCFGLHEWAMVLGQQNVRHDSWPLRLSQTEIKQTIDEQGLRCTHFDAFRFFTDEAAPLNPIQLTRNDQLTFEQPGCLHANMDLYKHAFALAPILGSEVVREAFALAREIRQVDMQVAPYDLRELGVIPIPVETPEGRAEFMERQRAFAHRATTLRLGIIRTIEAINAISVG